jgi:hypothetical protein
MATLVAPALQLNQAIALSHRMALHQGQSAGFRKQIHQHHRFVVDVEIVGTGDFPEQFVPDIGPRRLKREIIVDLTRHAVSWQNLAKGHPNRPASTMQDRFRTPDVWTPRAVTARNDSPARTADRGR